MLTSLDGPTQFPYNRSIDVEVHYAVIEYENRKAKPANYLVQFIDIEEPNDQWQEWFPERQVVGDPSLTRAIGCYNIYHPMWAMIEREKIVMHCR